jgi:hypothetical protein
VVVLLAILTGAACSERSEARSPERQGGPKDPHDVAEAQPDQPAPHGNHDPGYGGVVYMHGDLHFEVVFDPAGAHRVYFSDEVRTELPAAVVSGVRIDVTRPGEATEGLAARIDENGESWVAAGRRVEGTASARVSFMTPEGPYWIDVPVMAAQAP